MKLISVVFVLLLYFPLCASEPPKTTECLSLLDTQAKFQSYLDEISVSDWTFYLGKDPGQEQRLYLQARFKDYDSYSQSVIEERSGKRYLSVYMTKNEVIQQALSLALVAIEHQVRKNFFYKKQRIFGPHFNVDMLTEAKQSSSIDVSANNNAEESIDIWIANIETPYVSITTNRITGEGIKGIVIEVLSLESHQAYKALFIENQTSEIATANRILEAIINTKHRDLKRKFLVHGQAIYDTDSMALDNLVEVCADPNCLDRRSH